MVMKQTIGQMLATELLVFEIQGQSEQKYMSPVPPKRTNLERNIPIFQSLLFD